MSISKSTPVTFTVIRDLVSLICLAHRAEQTDEMDKIFWMGLSDLTMDQAARLAWMVPKETEFWPSPGKLRKLLGILTAEEQNERFALDCLQRLLESLRPVARDARRRERWYVAARRKMEEGDRIILTLCRLFGRNDLESAAEMLCLHPMLQQDHDGFGLDIAAIEKIERRWLKAWRDTQ